MEKEQDQYNKEEKLDQSQDQVVYQFQLTKNYSSTPVTRDYIYQ